MFKRNCANSIIIFLLLLTQAFPPKIIVAKTPKSTNKSLFSQNESYTGEIIIKFKKSKIDLKEKDNNSVSRKGDFLQRNKEKFFIKDELKNENLLVVEVKEKDNYLPILRELINDENIEFAEPNFIRHPLAINTNDTYKTLLWGLDNTGQTINGITGIADADIDAPEAWSAASENNDIIVAVIDSGIAYNHPDLINNLWDGSNCKDYEGNPLGGCIHGYDFQDNDKDPLLISDTHGTHVAGIIAATRNNDKGVIGVSSRAKIMAIRAGLTSSQIIKAIDFAIQNGAKVINASFGGNNYSAFEKTAIENFAVTGGIFIAAAGNSGENNDITPMYPASYDVDNIISVAATNQYDELASFSNYGSTSVDIGAPGTDILSAIATQTIAAEDFSAGVMPEGWVQEPNSNFGVSPDGTLWTDMFVPYASGEDYYIASPQINLSNVNHASMQFLTYCDTENTNPFGSSSDYIKLEASSDGVNFNEIARWNTYSLMEKYGYNAIKMETPLDDSYRTANFKFRFHWITDEDNDTGTDGYGCAIDDIEVVNYTDGSDEIYGYLSGTSMATPYVSGLAALLWSINPTLSYNQIKSAILDNGDSIASLAGKTVTGKRINAYSSVAYAMASLEPGPEVLGLENDLTPKKTKTWTWTSEHPDTDQFRYLIDQSINSVPTGNYGIGITSATISSGNGIFYLHVQAKNERGIEGPVQTVSCILDNLGPTSTVNEENNSSTSFVHVYNEPLFHQDGSAVANEENIANVFVGSTGVTITSAIHSNKSVVMSVDGSQLGSRIVYSTVPENSLFDALGNQVSLTDSFIFNGTHWQSNTQELNVTASSISQLFDSELFLVNPINTNQFTVLENVAIAVSESENSPLVHIAKDTQTTIESENQEITAKQLTASIPELSSITNYPSGYTLISALQFGIPNASLTFDKAVSISIYTGTEFNGNTLYVYRSSSGIGNWSNEGLITTTCTVENGYCNLQTTKASYFILLNSNSPSNPPPAPPPASPPSFSTSTSEYEFACRKIPPLQAPDLFQINTASGTARLYTTNVTNHTTSYMIIYGYNKDDERFGTVVNPINNNEGVQYFDINYLKNNQTYYFKIAALNDCVAGPWSDWIPAKINKRKSVVYKYKWKVIDKIKTLVNQFQ